MKRVQIKVKAKPTSTSTSTSENVEREAKVINPETRRAIIVGGPAYKSLIQRGYVYSPEQGLYMAEISDST